VEKYWYDANGKRIKKQNSDGEFTYYINKFYEIDNGTFISYFFRDDERVAKQTSEGMEWYLSDHIGSTSLMVDENGLVVECTDYFPYGQVRSGGLEKYGFTGQENDADTGLMYYGARYYSPEYSIFVQPDTMLPDPYNPQALNRYSYALNNPVKYTDPSGHFVDIVVDAGFLLMDLDDIRTGNADKWTYIGLATDVVCAFVPGVTGGRIGVQALEETVTHADNVGDLFKLLDKTADAEKNLDNVIDAGKTVNHVEDALDTSKYFVKADSLEKTRESLNNLDLDPNVRTNINRFLAGKNDYTDFTIKSVNDRSYLVTATKPGNVPGSYAIYYKEISSEGVTTKVWKETFDPKGNLVHNKIKKG
jgi:RHS repeat-associated protein